MRTTMTRALALRDPDLQGRRALVLGLGASGLAAARLLLARGARVTLADARDEDALGQRADEARALGATVRPGGHPPELAAEADLLVVSPGVPVGVDVIVAARRLGRPVWGEIELAARFCRGRVIGVTGSNGKSTVTAMTGHVLRGAGIPGGTGGNLATPFCELLADDGPDAVHAVELSSFQLETVETLQADVAVIVNLSPDHLDRHADLDAYADAKARLLALQRAEQAAVLNADDAPSRRFEHDVVGRLLRFSTRERVDAGAWVADGRLTLRTSDTEIELLGADELPLPGEHNLANTLAATLACALVGCPIESIAAGVRSFRALPHRLEPVREVRGVTFYNDSKATNPASVARAITSFGEGRVQLILGGKDKGGGWDELLPLVRRYAARVLLIGSAAAALRERLGDDVPLIDAGTVERAVRLGFEGAAPGDVVLLSPGCASFDQYRNFGERGEDFRRAVRDLAAEEVDGA